MICHTAHENLDVYRYQGSWNTLIKRHEMLRAVILKNGQQTILQSVPEFNVLVEDGAALRRAASFFKRALLLKILLYSFFYF